MKFTCPECHKEFDSNKVSPAKHAFSHFPVPQNRINDLRNAEAERRYRVLLDYEEKVEIERNQVTPKMPYLKQVVKEGSE